MQCAFWEWMVRGDSSLEPIIRDGKLKSPYGPYRARDLFKVTLNREDGPIWTFDRMGATRTQLADGRIIFIGGEHEDFYDPDFCIYNDVVVISPGGGGSADGIAIFGYPRELFPPTDFHTATLVDDKIIVIGSMGYPKDRRHGHTPIFTLDLNTLSLTRVETSGREPGWISRHEAKLGNDGLIAVSSGVICCEDGDGGFLVKNVDEYELDTNSWNWSRLTAHNWRQFSIRQAERGLFVLDHDPQAETLIPEPFQPTTMVKERNSATFLVRGELVRITVNISRVEVIIEGDVGDDAAHVIEQIRLRTEWAIGQRCTARELILPD